LFSLKKWRKHHNRSLRQSMYCYSNLFLLLFMKIIVEFTKTKFWICNNRILSILQIWEKVSDSVGFRICHMPGCQLSKIEVVHFKAFVGNELQKAFCFRTVRVSVGMSVGDYTPTVCEHDILQTACGNFNKFTTSIRLETKMNCLGFEVKRLDVRVTWRPNMVSNHLFKDAHFQRRRTDQHFTVEGRRVH